MCRGMQDLFDLIQSPTFVQQLGYGLLKIVLLNLLPELRPLFRSIERSAPESSASEAYIRARTKVTADEVQS